MAAERLSRDSGLARAGGLAAGRAGCGRPRLVEEPNLALLRLQRADIEAGQRSYRQHGYSFLLCEHNISYWKIIVLQHKNSFSSGQ
jgi:hypothetical protein